MAGVERQRIPGWTPDARPLAIAGIRAVLQAGVDAGRYPGAQAYASVQGEVLADLAFGEARIGEAMTPETIVSWQCNTKPVVGVAIAQLSERGLVDIDKPVASYIPAFAAHGKKNVTLRHLLTHTVRFASAFRSGGSAGSGRSFGADLSIEEREANLNNLELDPDFPVGRKAKYSMVTGYEIAAMVLRHVDGRPLTRYVRDEIFVPLGMDDCWIGVAPEAADDVGRRIAFLYDTQGAKPQTPLMMGGVAEGRDLERVSAGTGGIGPMRELARLYEALLASPRPCRGADPASRSRRRRARPVESRLPRRAGLLRQVVSRGVRPRGTPVLHGIRRSRHRHRRQRDGQRADTRWQPARPHGGRPRRYDAVVAAQ